MDSKTIISDPDELLVVYYGEIIHCRVHFRIELYQQLDRRVFLQLLKEDHVILNINISSLIKSDFSDNDVIENLMNRSPNKVLMKFPKILKKYHIQILQV